MRVAITSPCAGFGFLVLLVAACGGQTERNFDSGNGGSGGATSGSGGRALGGSAGSAATGVGGRGGAGGKAGSPGVGGAAGLAGSAGAGGMVPVEPGGFFVDGNVIRDTQRNQVQLRGVALPPLIWDPEGSLIVEDDFRLMRGWGANVVRIGLNQEFWLHGSAGTCDVLCYQARVDEVIGQAQAEGLAVILDLHWSTAGGAVPPQIMELPDADSLLFWADVAKRYKHDGTILFELYNEPHDVGWAEWREGGIISGLYDPDTSDTDYSRSTPITYNAVGMQDLYEAVRQTGAQNVVIIGGLNWAFDLSGITAFAIQGHNIAYATHLYPFAEKQPVYWDGAFGELGQQVPVIVSEFGPLRTADSVCRLSYAREVIDYSDALGLSWVAWAWFATGIPEEGLAWCDFPAFFYRETDPKLPLYGPTPYGELIEEALRR